MFQVPSLDEYYDDMIPSCKSHDLWKPLNQAFFFFFSAGRSLGIHCFTSGLELSAMP